VKVIEQFDENDDNGEVAIVSRSSEQSRVGQSKVLEGTRRYLKNLRQKQVAMQPCRISVASLRLFD
jgi:hypothetical protein